MSPSSRPTADELEAMPPAAFAAFLKETGMTRPSREALAAALHKAIDDCETVGWSDSLTTDLRPEAVHAAIDAALLAALPPAEVVEDPSVEDVAAALHDTGIGCLMPVALTRDVCVPTKRPGLFHNDIAAALHARLFGDTR